MFSLIKNVSGLFGPGPSEPLIHTEEEALAIINNVQEDDLPVESEVAVEVKDNECFYRTGEITFLDNHCGTIDGKYYFDNCTVRDVQVGDKVQYLAYTIDGDIRISKITSKYDEWDPCMEESSDWFKRRLVGKVTQRNGRKVICEPDNITIDLNKVESEFVPQVGDWIEMQCVVRADETYQDLCGEVLDILRITPLRPKVIVGQISKWNDDLSIGLINKDIFFTKESCIPGFIPIIGDTVCAEIIESDQKCCVWRAIKIVPEEEVTTTIQKVVVPDPNITALLENKNGIIIQDDINVKINRIGARAFFDINVENKSDEIHKIFGGEIRGNLRLEQNQIELKCPDFDDVLHLPPGKNVVFKFICYSKYMGITKELYIFKFEGFEIGRYINIEVKTELEIKNRLSFNPPRNKREVFRNARASMLDVSNNDILLGQKPVRPPSFITNKLPMYDIPQRLAKALFHEMAQYAYIGEIPIEKVAPCLAQKLTIQTYADRFHSLVYLEELSLQINMHKYDMKQASFIRNGEFLMLEVADLQERRPSVILGDKVMAYNPNTPNVKLEGFVHKTAARHVFLRFHQNFHDSYDGEDYTVEFQSSRTNFRRYHQAIDLAIRHLGKEFLFPSIVNIKPRQLTFEIDNGETSDNDSSPIKNKSNFDKKVRFLNDSEKENKIDENLNDNSNQQDNDNGNDNLNDNEKNNKDKNNKSNDKNNKSDDKNNKSDDKNNKSNDKNIKQSDENTIRMKPGVCPVKLKWFDEKLNIHQKRAVENILRGEARPLPYFIFGPPGTGKTVTLIETILQLVRLMPDSRLLVVAPSNSAADLIALRLLDSGALQPGDLVRMIAFRCVAESSIPKKLIPYCVTGDISREGSRESKAAENQGVRIGMQASVLGRHRITIGTCMVIGNIYTMGFPRGHFTHIIIDEAGQATEPEVLIPLCLLDVTSAQTILAGDPLQLGPCVFSRLSEAHGLSESFFERLIHRFPYVKDSVGFPETSGYDPRLVTRLIYNYRSLPEILELPNKLFYDSELIATISSTDSEEVRILNSLSTYLPQRKNSPHPPALVFHGVRGENFQTQDSPSWFNVAEAHQVFFYVTDLYGQGLTPADIGIITPYIKQGQQVRALFNDAELDMPKIGSVEEFQGQEFKVIILTTVRSNEAGAKNDSKYGLGFMASPRRLNVAITRAEVLLVIIGNPHLLVTDNYWRSVIKYAIRIGGYRGCDLPTSINSIKT